MIYYRRNILNIALVILVCGMCGFIINHVQHVYNRIQKHERLVAYEKMVTEINDYMRGVEERVMAVTPVSKWISSVHNDSGTVS